MRNLEFKARLLDLEAAQAAALRIGAELRGDLLQTDTYFTVTRGRLKLRETPGTQAELIYYEREETGELRASDYEIARTADGAALREMLSACLGVLAVVRKRRRLLLLDTARVHLDNIEGLGSFLEIEAPVKTDEPAAAATLATLMQGLGYHWGDCIRMSYLDLTLTAGQTENPR